VLGRGGGADIHVSPKEQKNRTFFCDPRKEVISDKGTGLDE